MLKTGWDRAGQIAIVRQAGGQGHGHERSAVSEAEAAILEGGRERGWPRWALTRWALIAYVFNL